MALEQENLQLRAQLQKVKEEIENIQKRKQQPGSEEIEAGTRTSDPPNNQQKPGETTNPKPRKPTDSGIHTKTKQRTTPEEEGINNKMMKEIQSLTDENPSRDCIPARRGSGNGKTKNRHTTGDAKPKYNKQTGRVK